MLVILAGSAEGNVIMLFPAVISVVTLILPAGAYSVAYPSYLPMSFVGYFMMK